MNSPRDIALIALLLAALVNACSPGQSLGPPTSRPGTAPPAGTSPADTQPPTTDGPAGTPGPLDLERLTVTLEPFVTIEGGPLAMTAPDDGSGRLFVASQNGRIWVIQDDVVLPQPLVNLDDRIQSGGEQGLLGIAVHPEFPADPRLFMDYTDNNGDTVVASLSLDPADPNRLDPGSHRQLLFIDDPFGNHNGGGTLFGPDGYLYITQGDGGSGGDPLGNGQNPDALLGKILRLDIDGATGDAGYAIPPDNPFVDRDGADEAWHLGLRNPWRVSFDRATGDLWIGDVGQGSWEEIDVARAGVGGLNFGWNIMEGAHCFRGETCDQAGLTLPVSEYGRELGCTVIGGYVYRGSAYPALVGAYLFADYCSGRIFAIDSATTELVPPVEVGSGSGSISAFGEDANGELYVMSLDGAVSRLVAATR